PRVGGRPGPDDTEGRTDGQPALFDHGLLGLPSDAELLAGLVAVNADQQRRLGGVHRTDRGLGLRSAAEAGGPVRPEGHAPVLTELLVPRPRSCAAPERLLDLAARIGDAFGQPLN